VSSNVNVAGLEIKQLRAGGSTNFVDVFDKLGKRMHDRIRDRFYETPVWPKTLRTIFFLNFGQICTYP
jgi:hypothetical protein